MFEKTLVARTLPRSGAWTLTRIFKAVFRLFDHRETLQQSGGMELEE